MDYNYIECLIERYFQCETNEVEEQILRDFFMQDELPQHLVQYKDLFQAFASESCAELPAEFDQKLMESIGSLKQKEEKPSRRMFISRVNRSLSPFYKAVASIALIITVGVTSSKYWNTQDSDPVNYNYSKYHDTYSDPEVACQEVTNALKDLGDALKGNGVMISDSAYSQPVMIRE